MAALTDSDDAAHTSAFIAATARMMPPKTKKERAKEAAANPSVVSFFTPAAGTTAADSAAGPTPTATGTTAAAAAGGTTTPASGTADDPDQRTFVACTKRWENMNKKELRAEYARVKTLGACPRRLGPPGSFSAKKGSYRLDCSRTPRNAIFCHICLPACPASLAILGDCLHYG